MGGGAEVIINLPTPPTTNDTWPLELSTGLAVYPSGLMTTPARQGLTPFPFYRWEEGLGEAVSKVTELVHGKAHI